MHPKLLKSTVAQCRAYVDAGDCHGGPPPVDRLIDAVVQLAGEAVAGDCPSCGKGDGKVTAAREDVPYGSEGAVASVVVPLHTCTACGFRWTDESGSVIRDFAIAEARGTAGVNTPDGEQR